MKESIRKLEDMQATLKELVRVILKKHNSLSREVVFSSMVVKKAIDILAMSEYALKNNIISVQISLLRLMCDNCLAVEASLELGLVKMMELINTNQRVSSIMLDEEQNMSDGYLKRRVSEKYQGFDRLYKFACDGVHFSKQAMAGAFYKGEDGLINMNINIGNPELRDEVISNNNSMITLCKVLIDMLKRLCL